MVDSMTVIPTSEQLRVAMPHVELAIANRLWYHELYDRCDVTERLKHCTFVSDDTNAHNRAALSTMHTWTQSHNNIVANTAWCTFRSGSLLIGKKGRPVPYDVTSDVRPLINVCIQKLVRNVPGTKAYFSYYLQCTEAEQRRIAPLYASVCQRRVSVSMEQCIRTDQYWATNTRKQKFEDEVTTQIHQWTADGVQHLLRTLDIQVHPQSDAHNCECDDDDDHDDDDDDDHDDDDDDDDDDHDDDDHDDDDTCDETVTPTTSAVGVASGFQAPSEAPSEALSESGSESGSESVSLSESESASVVRKDATHPLLTELQRLYMRHMSVIYLYITRNRNTVDLHKYADGCNKLYRTMGVDIQLYNLRDLMYNVTEHIYVPLHLQYDTWYDNQFVKQRLKSINFDVHTTTTTQGRTLSCISSTDPVAKLVGLRIDNLCVVLRMSQSGLSQAYRMVS